MNYKILATAAMAVTILATGSLSLAAEKGPSPKPPMNMQGSGGMQMDDKMMHGGMMEMMGECKRMMHGGTTGQVWSQLPAGNDKLQLQMHAEMLQKIGEIEAKYAAQIKDERK